MGDVKYTSDIVSLILSVGTLYRLKLMSTSLSTDYTQTMGQSHLTKRRDPKTGQRLGPPRLEGSADSQSGDSALSYVLVDGFQ